MLHWSEILLRLVLAACFGAAIGLERERKDWAAGMRTHMMVCVGSALTMMVSAFGFSDILGTAHVELDPSRVAAQVISGIGFLGAGTILFLKPATVKGLTTASGLWTIAGIGLATGGGMYFAAAAATIIAFVILWLLPALQRKLNLRPLNKSLKIKVEDKTDTTAILEKIWNSHAMEFSNFSIIKVDNDYSLDITLTSTRKKEMATIISELQSLPYVKEIIWN